MQNLREIKMNHCVKQKNNNKYIEKTIKKMKIIIHNKCELKSLNFQIQNN